MFQTAAEISQDITEVREFRLHQLQAMPRGMVSAESQGCTDVHALPGGVISGQVHIYFIFCGSKISRSSSIGPRLWSVGNVNSLWPSDAIWLQLHRSGSTNVDLSSNMFFGIHMWAIWLEVPMKLISYICSKITLLKLQPHTPKHTHFSEMLVRFIYFHSIKHIGKCRLRNGGHFVSASMC